MGYFCREPFPGFQPCVSLVGGMTLLTAALMRWEKLLKLYESKKFLRRFPFFKRINRVCRFDGFLWNLAKMFLGYQCAKVCEAFLIFQIFFLVRALNLRRSANIQFANFKIEFLGNQSEYRKSLTQFCNLSPTDWHCALCLLVLASRKAGKARFKRRTLHVPNLMQMRKIYCFRSFALDSAHVKFDVWTGSNSV